MCSEINAEDFVQVDVSGDGEKCSNSDHRTSHIPASSENESSHNVGPPGRPAIDEVSNHQEDDDDDIDSDFEDETIVERLIGLTEMFPDWFRNAVSSTFTSALNAAKGTYSFSRGTVWFLASTATVCLLPIMLEVERAQMEEQEASEHRSMMLGPGGVGGAGLAGFQANMPILSPVSSK